MAKPQWVEVNRFKHPPFFEMFEQWAKQGATHIKGYIDKRNRNLSVIVTNEPGNGWHLSVAHRKRQPTWEEQRDARYYFLPDVPYMCMLLPPRDEYVNEHKNCFHWFECPLGFGEGKKC